jgi:HD-GYP domain-containing protein (c-di-GMP phosphodiesterase class II)
VFFYIISFVLIVSGGVFIVLSAVEYHKLFEYYKEETYQSLRLGYKVNLILLYFFVLVFLVEFVDVFLRDMDAAYAFSVLILLLVAIYIFFSVKTQAAAAVMLREKTLEAMRTFVNAIDLKDYSRSGHSKHVYDVVNLFYEKLDDYWHVLNKMKLLDAAILHDIGKINISAEVFNKSDDLSQEEWEMVKSHPLKGKEMLDQTIFSEISDWVKYHHERVDGNGYYGLSSEDIPLESKIIAVADAYSALCSDRAYRRRFSHTEAITIIVKEAGKQFDRKLAERFVQLDGRILEQL